MGQNEQQPIHTYSLRELFAQAGRQAPGILGECIAVNSASQLKAFEIPSRIDAFIIGVGTEGETSGLQNMKAYTLRRDTLFVFSPKNILQTHSNSNFRCHVIVITPALMQRVHIDLKHLMPLLLSFGANPCMAITPAESSMLRRFITLIEEQLTASETPFSYDILGGLVTSTFYKVGEILEHHITSSPSTDPSSGDRTESYFRHFMQLLGENFRDQRNVSYYAQQLCITPKYLTTIIKRLTGLSVSEWIDNYVILEAKTLLKYSDMSIQEIAYTLNFTTQSFFGSYFKRNTGITPTHYRTTGGEGVPDFMAPAHTKRLAKSRTKNGKMVKTDSLHRN